MRGLSRQTVLWILAFGALTTFPHGLSHAQDTLQRQSDQVSASDVDETLVTDTLASMQDDAQKEQAGAERDPIAPPEPPAEALSDPATRNAYLAAVQEYYRYRTSGFLHRRLVFEWQHWSTKVIFGIVLALVTIGTYFAVVQFHLGLRPKHGAQGSEAGADSTEFVASIQGIRVRSPILGVIILVISMAFFYLYLAFVYPIQEVL